MSEGYIGVRVTNSGGNFPIEGAVVTITDYNEGAGGKLLYSLRTDESGKTPTVPVRAEPKGESLTPGIATPYTLYNIRASKEGYSTSERIGVPVFEGVVSIQPIPLIPLTEREIAEGMSPVISELSAAPSLGGSGEVEQ